MQSFIHDPFWDLDWHYTSPYLGEAWTDNRQGKPRRIVLIRCAWHLSRDSDLATLIHTTFFDQASIRFDVWRNSRMTDPDQTGLDSEQEALSFID